MATLTEIASAARNADFAGRVQAATVVLGLPFHPNQVMHVAGHVDLTNGPDAVPDAEILAALVPEDAPTGA